jgi:quinol monooxygenase YgiN
MGKIALFARLVAKPGLGEKVRAALEDSAAAAAKEPGTLVYVAHSDPTDENVVWMYEVFANAEARTAHSGSEATAQFLSALADVLQEPISVQPGEPFITIGVPAIGLPST